MNRTTLLKEMAHRIDFRMRRRVLTIQRGSLKALGRQNQKDFRKVRVTTIQTKLSELD
jgi:hypothetical protein